MATQQADNIRQTFRRLVDEAIADFKAQAIDRDGVLPDYVNDGEVLVLAFGAFSFFIAAEPRFAPDASALNAALTGELTRAITYYADRGRIGSRPFREDERAGFAQAIYVQVDRGVPGYVPKLRQDLRHIAERQTIIFTETSAHFVTRYITEPAAREKIAASRAAYTTLIDQVIDRITLCLVAE
jgi:hypothetical protein